ncbi:ATPase, T2SS/T4P/T4SS family [Acidiferrobacter sp.]|uniref:ATPase, T2SS/T4P/T4SS family n=1 Tax=Acidiferrobacter sp. TaxID=1872107 RepID=UPI00260B2A42|nr:ATPase, T2SS/T4P/T4SS family [Acidiferrobacter sp.]
MFQVRVESNSGAHETWPCLAPECRVGKSEENLIVLQGWMVAAHHATIYREGLELFVRDEGTRGGTVVNGERLRGPYGPLRNTDEIGIAGYRLRVYEDRAATTPDVTVAQVPVAEGPRIDFAILRSLHERLIARMDFRRIDTAHMGDVELRAKTRGLLEELLAEDEVLPGGHERALLLEAALNEVVGLGPIEGLLEDATVSEVMVNRFDEIFIERNGRLESSPVVFSSEHAVRSVIERIVAPLGRRIDESSPMVDGRLKDGSRVNAVIPPVALKGPSLTIRKFSKERLTDAHLIRFGSADERVLAFLRLAVEQRRSILISGGTGSGKTTLLNILAGHIPSDERIVTIEDAAELRLFQPNLVSLESRPANAEGKGEINIRDLVRNSLRMRPDRIVVGECRGGEALDMLQAMNTGHDGSLTTVHANTPRDALSRLEVMVLMAGMDLPVAAIRQQISSAIDVIVQQSRLSDGSRKITHVVEVTGMENQTIQMQEIFRYQQAGVRTDGRVMGRFVASGHVPEFYEELVERGLSVDRSIFMDDGGVVSS